MASAVSQQALAAKFNVAGKQLSCKKHAKTTRAPRACIRAAASTATVSDADSRFEPENTMKRAQPPSAWGGRDMLFRLRAAEDRLGGCRSRLRTRAQNTRGLLFLQSSRYQRWGKLLGVFPSTSFIPLPKRVLSESNAARQEMFAATSEVAAPCAVCGVRAW